VQIIKQKISGNLIVDGELAAVMLSSEDCPDFVYLAYALITQGTENHILPSLLLDDWGNEIRRLRLYQWIRKEGDRFPRAEVFGLDLAGGQIQHFLRDIELFARFPVYAWRSDDSPMSSILPVSAILLEEPGVSSPQLAEPPPGISFPLRNGRVNWWKVGTRPNSLGFLQRGSVDL
jgi:hypothetical protein